MMALSRIAGEGACGRSPEAGKGLRGGHTLTRPLAVARGHPLPRCGRGAMLRFAKAGP
jgi:hypothetical protein